MLSPSDLDFAAGLLAIIFINVVLSGDNVIVIGMAAASLPRSQRRLAIVGGGTLAIVLRVVLTAAAAVLVSIPYVSALGGFVLLWVAWGLMKADFRRPDDEMVEEAASLRRAMELIVIADVTMSFDNVLAVAGTADGDLRLLIIGLLVSMPLLLLAGGALSLLIDRYRWLVFVGAGAICFAGARMIVEDERIRALVAVRGPEVAGIGLATAIVLPAIFLLLRRRRSGESIG